MNPIQSIPKPKPAPAAPPRMTLAAVSRGRTEQPPRVLLYGVEGVGKSTFAASAPSPIFLAAEQGTGQLDVARFPKPETWQDVLDAVRTLTVDAHDYKTFVVDTLDALEPLCWSFICQRDGKASLDAYGYAKGPAAALAEWRLFLAAVERLWTAKGVTVIFLAHAVIRPFKNPEGDDYDRYQLKLNDKAGGLIKEWTDFNLFARFETFANKKAGELKAKGVSTGARVIHTTRTAAYDAKHRGELDDMLPLDWQTFYEATQRKQSASPTALRESIAAHLATLADADTATKVNAAVEKAGDDTAQLAKINNKLATLASAKEQG